VVIAESAVLAESCKIGSGCGFPSPDTSSFDFKPAFWIGSWGVTKPTILMVIGAVVIAAIFLTAFRKPKLVPRGLQNVAELGYLFVRDQISRETIGKKGDKFVPFLATLFFFVWVMNLMSIIPVAQFPVMSRFAFPVALAIMVWLIYNYIGIKNQGVVGYFKNMMFPPGLPIGIYPILAPIEFFSTVIVRPFTLAVRLFANMFAGHLLLLIFTLGSAYLLVPRIEGLFSAVSFGMVAILTGFELLIQFLQAYIFTLLTASYISGALEAEH
jgi:F-type H+-transporting ATPase subunit a